MKQFHVILNVIMFTSLGFCTPKPCAEFPKEEEKFFEELCKLNPQILSNGYNICDIENLKHRNSETYEFGNTLNGRLQSGQKYQHGTLKKKCVNNNLSIIEMSFSSIGIEKIPESIKHLSNLEKLVVIDDQFKINELPSTLAEIKGLKHLDLAPHHNAGAVKQTLSKISKIKQLEWLRIVIAKDPTNNGEWLSNLHNLKTLSLISYKWLIPTTITKLNKLENLYLDTNYLPTFWDQMKGLRELYVSSEDEILPESIKNLSKLEVLSIRSSHSLKELPDWIGDLTNLKKLNITTSEIKTLPKTIGKLHKLEELSVTWTPLEILPDFFSNLTALKKIELSRTKLTDLPDSLRKLKDQATIRMEPNTLSMHGQSVLSEFNRNEYYSRLNSGFSDSIIRESALVSIDYENIGVIGSHTKEQVSKIVSAYMGQIKYCYERQIQKEPNLKGDIVVKFNIANQGSVDKAVVSTSTLESPTVKSCVTGVVKRMPFPASGSTQVTIPLHFKVNKPKK